MSKLPSNLRRFFWDVDFNKIDLAKNKDYIIGRILEYGDNIALRWLFKTYPKNAVIDILKTSRQLSVKSANFWAGLLRVDKNKVRCLQKQYQSKSQQIWPY